MGDQQLEVEDEDQKKEEAAHKGLAGQQQNGKAAHEHVDADPKKQSHSHLLDTARSDRWSGVELKNKKKNNGIQRNERIKYQYGKNERKEEARSRHQQRVLAQSAHRKSKREQCQTELRLSVSIRAWKGTINGFMDEFLKQRSGSIWK